MKRTIAKLNIVALAVAMMLTACHTQKTPTTVRQDVYTLHEHQDLLEKVENNQQQSEFVTSRIKFTIDTGNLHQALTGKLMMKRDDVIRIQLMAFGFVEAGRMEFTKDKVMVVDRINKKYVDVPYENVSFLRRAGINFFSLQALFWDELFQPGKERLTEKEQKNFVVELIEDMANIRYEQIENVEYSWAASQKTGIISQANILFKNPGTGNSQLNWDYKSFKKLNGKDFPVDMDVTLTMPEREVKLGIVLNYLKNENDWNTRTEVSAKYQKVEVEEILRGLMAL